VSGRAKGAPRDPQEEREQLRQLTRELHEAAQAANDAARELREARASVRGKVEDTITAFLEEAVAEVNRRVYDEAERVVQSFADAGKKIEERHAALLEFESAQDMMTYIVNKMMADFRSEEFLAMLAGHVEAQVVLSPGNKGLQGHLSMSLTNGPAPIMVGTAEQVSAYRAAGGDPGIVLDMR
jgi:hypothetical protein